MHGATYVMSCSGPGLVLIEGIGGGPTKVEELLDIDPVLPWNKFAMQSKTPLRGGFCVGLLPKLLD